MKKQKFTYRMLALAMCLCMIFTMMPMAAHATTHEHDASCGYAPASECNHTHDGTCGYADAVDGSDCIHSCTDGTCSYVAATDEVPCNHVCDFDVCGYVPAIPGTPCDKGCSEIVDGEIQHNNCDYSEGEPEMPCTHTHDASCGYVAPTSGTACDHSHNANCGYVEAVDAQPCTHEHDGTCGYSEGSECTYVETPVDETEHTHSWSEEWAKNGTSHWHECTASGCSLSVGVADLEKSGYGEHSYDSNYTCTTCNYTCPHTGAETNYDMDSTHHWGVCGYGTCGYTTAKETHDQNGENGSCSVCYYDPNSSTDPDEHVHEWADSWTNDDTHHWHECTADGCDVTENIGKYGYAEHSYTAVVTDPTCNQQGYTTYTCACGKSYVGDYKDAIGHDWGNWISNNNGTHYRFCGNNSAHWHSGDCNGEATCHELAICSYCGASHGGYNRLNHSGGTEVRNAKDATETEAGYTGDTYCLGCGIKISEGSIIQATGSGDDGDDTHTHIYDYYKYDGTNHWMMCVCGQGQAGSVKAHTLLIQGNNNGHWKECTICNYDSDIQAHVYSNDSDASCNDCGYERHVHHNFYSATCTSPAKCSCYAIIGDIDPSNHAGGTEIRNAVEATYETEGYTGDTYCKGCGEKLASGKYTMRKGFVDVKYDDDAVVKEVTFQTVEGVTLPEDAEVIVKDHTATLAPIDSLLGRDVNTEYLDINDLDITIIENDTYTHPDGTEYRIGEILSINGEEYVISNWTGTGDILSLSRLSDGASCNYNAVTNVLDFGGSLITTPGEYPFERVNIGGVTYDVVLYFADIEGSGRTTYLYYNGIPAGKMRSGGYYFCKGYDPATLAAQQQDTGYIGTVTPGENPVDGLMSGKTYNVSVIGSNDISVPGAENVTGTITQIFEIPVEFVGNENVKFVAVHEATTGVEHGTVTLAEDGQTLIASYAVDGFSPFTVYAFVEADEPEIKTLSATIVDGSDDTTEAPDTSEPVVSPQTSDSWIWYVLVAVAAGTVIVATVIYGKRRKSKAN